MEAQQHGDQLKRGLKTAIYSSSPGRCYWYWPVSGQCIGYPVGRSGHYFGVRDSGFHCISDYASVREMVVEEPVAGSFSHFAYKYWGSFAGFASGWNYWVLYVLVAMAELTAVGKYIQFWYPEIPTGVCGGLLRPD